MEDKRFRSCTSGFFKLIDEVWRSERRKVVLHRLCTVMRKMQAQTVVCEELEADGASEWRRLARESGAIDRRIGRNLSYTFTKLTFLCARVQNEAELVTAIDSGRAGFLGYAIVVGIRDQKTEIWNYVVESVVRQNSLVTLHPSGEIGFQRPINHFLHVKKRFNAKCLERDYVIEGSFFCQQNAITGTCAHACAVMVLNNCKETETVVACEDVNLCLNTNGSRREKIDDRLLARFQASNDGQTEDGLSSDQMEAVFRSYGFEPKRHDFKGHRERYFREFLYGFVESGYPAVLTFNTIVDERTSQHVVPAFGHTLNFDSWFPIAFASYVGQSVQKPYLSSLAWVDDFIAHDDNFGMQFCIPAHSFRPEDHPDPGKSFAPVEVIGIFPAARNVRLFGHEAERLAQMRIHSLIASFLKSEELPIMSYHLKHLLPHLVDPKQRTAVFRSTLVSREQYMNHLRGNDSAGVGIGDENRRAVEKVLERHEYFWLVEVTEPDLYVGNKSKIIDLLLDCQMEPPQSQDKESNIGVLLVQFPGFAMVPHGRKDYVTLFNTAVQGYFPLYSHEIDSVVW